MTLDDSHECVYCGKPTDYYGPDPYSSEINDDHTEYWICSECYSNRADDI